MPHQPTIAAQWTDAERQCAKIRAFWIRQGYQGISAEPRIEKLAALNRDAGEDSFVTIKTNVGPHGFPPKRVA